MNSCFNRRSRTALAAFAFGSCAVLPAAAQTIVAPNAFATTNGGGIATTAPFNNVSRYQQIYAASQFSALTGPELITQIAFRPTANQAAISNTDQHIQFDLSTTTEAVSSLSSTFAANVGSNDQTVYNGVYTFSAPATGAGVSPFDIIISLTNPFLYNPATGNLVLDIHNFGAGFTGYVDGGADPSTKLVFVDNSTAAPTGNVQNFGITTQFGFAPVPEASTEISFSLLLSLGVLAIAVRRKKAHAEV